MSPGSFYAQQHLTLLLNKVSLLTLQSKIILEQILRILAALDLGQSIAKQTKEPPEAKTIHSPEQSRDLNSALTQIAPT